MRQKQLIISIDGGGIRGIVPLILLKEIQHKITNDLNTFDPDWWGTSTGALISSSIVVQQGVSFAKSVQNVLDLYEFRAKFAVQSGSNQLPSKALTHLIDTNFSAYSLTDISNLNLVASHADTFDPVVFNANNPTRLSDAIKASCAFPNLFPPVNIDGVDYLDGYFKAKNPSFLSLNKDYGDKELIILSLGTGQLPVTDEMERQAKKVDAHMKGLHESEKLHYYRLNPPLILANHAMQNATAKNILNLRKDAYNFAQKEAKKIEEFLSHLTAS
jgi:predicted acylesterase/phospholipase RssA